jgi:hypothetical protein
VFDLDHYTPRTSVARLAPPQPVFNAAPAARATGAESGLAVGPHAERGVGEIPDASRGGRH